MTMVSIIIIITYTHLHRLFSLLPSNSSNAKKKKRRQRQSPVSENGAWVFVYVCANNSWRGVCGATKQRNETKPKNIFLINVHKYTHTHRTTSRLWARLRDSMVTGIHGTPISTVEEAMKLIFVSFQLQKYLLCVDRVRASVRDLSRLTRAFITYRTHACVEYVLALNLLVSSIYFLVSFDVAAALAHIFRCLLEKWNTLTWQSTSVCGFAMCERTCGKNRIDKHNMLQNTPTRLPRFFLLSFASLARRRFFYIFFLVFFPFSTTMPRDCFIQI